MTADTEPAAEARGHLVEVFLSLDLRLNGEGEEHIEVLLPADKGVVGAAEGDKAQAVAELDHHCGELHLPFVVDLVDVAAEPEVAVAFALRKSAQQPVVAVPEKGRCVA